MRSKSAAVARGSRRAACQSCAAARRRRARARTHAASQGASWHGARVSRRYGPASTRKTARAPRLATLGAPVCRKPALRWRRSDSAQHARSARHARAHTRASGHAMAPAATRPRPRSWGPAGAAPIALATRRAHDGMRRARRHHGGHELRRGGREHCSHDAWCCAAGVLAAQGVAARHGQRPGQRRGMHGCAEHAAGCGCTPCLPLLATSSLLSLRMLPCSHTSCLRRPCCAAARRVHHRCSCGDDAHARR